MAEQPSSQSRKEQGPEEAKLDPDRVAAWWHANSVAQGLPDEVDPTIIRRVAVLALTDPRPATPPRGES